jgi:hypothetical protein
MSENQDTPVTGRCLCGDIRYEYTGTPVSISYCHCDTCRRHVSGPIAAFVCVRRDTFRFTQGQPVAYASSARVTRTHCGRCGSPIAYESADSADIVELYLGTLRDQTVTPTHHVHVGEQLPWFETADALPRYERGTSAGPPVRPGPRRTDLKSG